MADDLFDDILARTAEAAAARQGCDRFSQESAAQASIAQQLAALGVLAISEGALTALPPPLSSGAAAALALSYIGSLGDVYSDSEQSSASVAAAENISTLAGRLTRHTAETSFELQGSLRLNGEHRAAVGVTLDGRLHLRDPESVLFDEDGNWTVHLATGRSLRVTLFVTDGEPYWVVDDRDLFYSMVLGEAA